MQIVRGRFRHRKLLTTPGLTTRPITTRVKVSLFDRLQPILAGSRVADVFSGTGTLGLEALSRGASRVLFVEKDSVAFDLLQKNVSALKVEEEVLCWKTDASRCSFKPRRGEEFLPLDLVFFDPPYIATEKMDERSLLYRAFARLGRDEISSPKCRLLLRCARNTPFPVPPVWKLTVRFDFNNMSIHVFEKEAAVSTQVAPEIVEGGDENAPAENSPETNNAKGEKPPAAASHSDDLIEPGDLALDDVG
jgi:16S rRNA (guanine966-N2)-methyltransferase